LLRTNGSLQQNARLDRPFGQRSEQVPKMFVFDLDGTLLDSKKQLSKRSRKAIEDLNRLGNKITIATARPPRATRHILDLFSFPIDLVSYNGSVISSYQFGEHSFAIHNDLFRKLHNYLRESDPNSIISIENSDMWSCTQHFDFCSFFHTSHGPQNVSIVDFLEKCPNKILVNNCTRATGLVEMFNDLVNIIVTDGGSLIQIMPKNSSKERAVEYLLQKHTITFEDTICFGDDHNDLGLFLKCGNSIAMENGIEELKSIATYITDSNDEDGVASYIEKFI